MRLSVSAYDRAEREAESRLSNRIIEAGKPSTFALRGYPIAVDREEALWRYVDVMHELGEEQSYEETLGGLLSEEFDLFSEVTRAVARMTQERYGCRMVPKGSLVRAFISYRFIRSISPPSDTSVLEIGPGSGYLGVLLAMTGYRYAATEVTQGFYLHQNHLWEYLFGDRLVELAQDSRQLREFKELPSGVLLHIPWWKFHVVDADRLSLSLDVVTANHALCEMHPTSFNYTLRVSHRFLQALEGLKYFFVEGPGAPELRDHRQMVEAFLEAGYVSVFQEFPVDIFSPVQPNDSLYATRLDGREPPLRPAGAAAAPPEEEGEGPAPSSAERLQGVRRVALRALRHPARTTRTAAQRLLGRSPRQRSPVATPSDPVASDPAPQNDRKQTKINVRIADRRAALVGEERVSLEAVRRLQRSLLEGAALQTDDERFLRFAFGRDHW